VNGLKQLGEVMNIRIAAHAIWIGFILILGVGRADTIEMTNGDIKPKVQVVKEGLHKVIYKKAGLPDQSVPSDKVKEVKYHATGPDYKTAMAAYADGDYETAAGLYRDYADSLSDKKTALKAHCYFMVADCLQKARMWKEAIVEFTQFANVYQDHRLFPQALLNRAISYIGNQEMKKAQEGFTLLREQVSKKKLSDFWRHEVEYWLISMREDRDPKNALDDYKALYEASKEFPTVSSKARLGIGQVLIKQKKFKDAHSFFSEIIENRVDADRAILAGAYLGRGRCTLNQPSPKEEDFKSALFDLLRVVLYYSDVDAWQAEAMYWAGKCFQNLGGKDSGKHWQSLYRRLQREWPGTNWAQLASKEI
jgi:TolA-binding protein